jgi:AraC-like DNA-binding protein
MGQGMADPAVFPAIQAIQLIELVGRWNVSAEDLLAPVGLTKEAVSDPAGRLPLPVVEKLISRARALTGEPGLGFYLGLQMRISSLGYVGFAAMTSATIRDAIEIGVRYTPTRTTALGMRLHTDGPLASIVIEELADLGSARDVVLLWLMVGISQIGETLTGKPLSGTGTVDVAAPEPSYFGRFRDVVAGRVRFNQPMHRLVFDAAILDLPLVLRDPSALQLAKQQCERELNALGFSQSLSAGVRRVLLGEDRGFRALEDVARRLGMSTRTLKRKLAGEGTSFSQILDEERRERALLLVHSPELSLEQVAERVGYTDLANFTRAFRRWTGTTPAAFRRSQPR